MFDYDMDLTPEVDKLKVEVFRNNEEPIVLEAIETEENNGIFRTEIDTSAEEEEGKLRVVRRPGELAFVDPQTPSRAFLSPRRSGFRSQTHRRFRRIDETRSCSPIRAVRLPLPSAFRRGSGSFRFCYEMPLTVE